MSRDATRVTGGGVKGAANTRAASIDVVALGEGTVSGVSATVGVAVGAAIAMVSGLTTGRPCWHNSHSAANPPPADHYDHQQRQEKQR